MHCQFGELCHQRIWEFCSQKLTLYSVHFSIRLFVIILSEKNDEVAETGIANPMLIP